MNPAEIRIAYLDDGTPYDDVTGEILDATSPEVQLLMDAHPPNEEIKARWDVQDEQSAEWCLERLGEIDGEIAFWAAKKKAITKQIDTMIAEREKRRAWWHVRFGSSLVAFAKSTLGKTKTRRFVNGTVSFRKSAGRREILRHADAKEFVRRWRPDLIRVVEEPVRLSDIDEAIAAAVKATDDQDYTRPDWLYHEGEKTNVKIDTLVPAALATNAPKEIASA